MKQLRAPLKVMIAIAAAAFAGASASAQTTTTTSTTTSTTSTISSKPTSATPQMIQEACQRQRARTAKFRQFGIPEQFGSEEPFTFDRSKPCP
jgi:guanyl-specific ribonuclease Sa